MFVGKAINFQRLAYETGKTGERHVYFSFSSVHWLALVASLQMGKKCNQNKYTYTIFSAIQYRFLYPASGGGAPSEEHFFVFIGSTRVHWDSGRATTRRKKSVSNHFYLFRFTGYITRRSRKLYGIRLFVIIFLRFLLCFVSKSEDITCLCVQCSGIGAPFTENYLYSYMCVS